MTTKKGKQKRVPPSRVRYEERNPVVSLRISREFHEELLDLQATTGMSMADILKAGLDKIQPDAEEIYERGFRDGYGVAREEFEVFAPCGACGKAHLSVTGPQMKGAVAQRLSGWNAKNCRDGDRAG